MFLLVFWVQAAVQQQFEQNVQRAFSHDLDFVTQLYFFAALTLEESLHPFEDNSVIDLGRDVDIRLIIDRKDKFCESASLEEAF